MDEELYVSAVLVCGSEEYYEFMKAAVIKESEKDIMFIAWKVEDTNYEIVEYYLREGFTIYLWDPLSVSEPSRRKKFIERCRKAGAQSVDCLWDNFQEDKSYPPTAIEGFNVICC